MMEKEEEMEKGEDYWKGKEKEAKLLFENAKKIYGSRLIKGVGCSHGGFHGVLKGGLIITIRECPSKKEHEKS
jgi:hypothetical protein